MRCARDGTMCSSELEKRHDPRGCYGRRLPTNAIFACVSRRRAMHVCVGVGSAAQDVQSESVQQQHDERRVETRPLRTIYHKPNLRRSRRAGRHTLRNRGCSCMSVVENGKEGRPGTQLGTVWCIMIMYVRMYVCTYVCKHTCLCVGLLSAPVGPSRAEDGLKCRL
jgi:hypothetical protein